MEILAYHHSHEEFYHSPFGAVPCGSSLRLRILVQSEYPLEECFLRLWIGGKEYLYPMVKMGSIDQHELHELEHRRSQGYFAQQGGGPIMQGAEIFSVNYDVPDVPGPIWYFFMFKANQKVYFYGNNPEVVGGEGTISLHEPPGYQVTVYEPMSLPDWYKRGIMYQIYVDRFFNGNEQGKVFNLPKKSLLHGDWYDTPFYIKNAEGEVLRWDFFGGNLLGVLKKLPYLKELGISIVYFNPIFESSSNHKYDTGDYLKIDPMYGDAEIFASLVKEARKLGISIILDGVFSHTGDDSIYFNRYGHYPSRGAYQSADSPYYSWYKWKGNGEYTCWWGVKTLPEVNEMDPSYREFIIHSPEGVLQTWMKYGVKGWRLDVADELPDEFIQEFRQVMKAVDPEAVLIGEVWEDPTHKYSYGKLRRYFWGKELDATTNYPFREIFLRFLLGEVDAFQVHGQIMNLYENYPPQNFFGQMNLIGSHDRARILTLLGEAPPPEKMSTLEQENYRLSPHQRWLATRRLKLFTLIQMSFPGVPCLYYGDEAGLEGYPDPFNRGTYPWDREDQEILHWVKRVLRYRREYEVLIVGEFRSFPLGKDIYAFKRQSDKEEIFILINRNAQEHQEVQLQLEEDVEQVVDIFEGDVSYRKNSQLVLKETAFWESVLLQDSNQNKLSLNLPPLGSKALLLQKYPRENSFKQEIFTRSCGILMPISSLPSPWGIGDLGEEAYGFVDFLARAGQSLWQILPLNPLGQGDSPYQSESAFAGNPLLISLDLLIEAGLLTEEEVLRAYAGYNERENERVYEGDRGGQKYKDFTWVRIAKEGLLRLAFGRFKKIVCWEQIFKKIQDFSRGIHPQDVHKANNQEGNTYLNPQSFCEFVEANRYWLEDYGIFKCLKHKYSDLPWNEWEEKYCLRAAQALEALAAEFAEEIAYVYFVQYTFEYQWQRLKKYANGMGIKLLEIFPSMWLMIVPILGLIARFLPLMNEMLL